MTSAREKFAQLELEEENFIRRFERDAKIAREEGLFRLYRARDLNPHAETIEALADSCMRCGYPREAHVDRKCPFAPTNYRQCGSYVAALLHKTWGLWAWRKG